MAKGKIQSTRLLPSPLISPLLLLFLINYIAANAGPEEANQNAKITMNGQKNGEEAFDGISSILSDQMGNAVENYWLSRRKVVPQATKMVPIMYADLALPPDADPLLKAILRGLKALLGGAGIGRDLWGNRLKEGPKLEGDWPPPDWMELTEWAGVWQSRGKDKGNYLFTAFAPHCFELIREKLGVDSRGLLLELVQAMKNAHRLSRKDDKVLFELKNSPTSGNSFLISQIKQNEKRKELKELYEKVKAGTGTNKEEHEHVRDLPPLLLLGIFRVQQLEPAIDLLFSLEEQRMAKNG